MTGNEFIQYITKFVNENNLENSDIGIDYQNDNNSFTIDFTVNMDEENYLNRYLKYSTPVIYLDRHQYFSIDETPNNRSSVKYHIENEGDFLISLSIAKELR